MPSQETSELKKVENTWNGKNDAPCMISFQSCSVIVSGQHQRAKHAGKSGQILRDEKNCDASTASLQWHVLIDHAYYKRTLRAICETVYHTSNVEDIEV